MQETEEILDLNKVFDKYLASHNEDRHTMRQTWMDGARWMARHLADTLYKLDADKAAEVGCKDYDFPYSAAAIQIIMETSDLMEKANASK
jgi:hypothetical protein